MTSRESQDIPMQTSGGDESADLGKDEINEGTAGATSDVESSGLSATSGDDSATNDETSAGTGKVADWDPGAQSGGGGELY